MGKLIDYLNNKRIYTITIFRQCLNTKQNNIKNILIKFALCALVRENTPSIIQK